MEATIRNEQVSKEHWEFVKGLLRDLEAEEICEALGSHFGQWRLSIKAFRRVEALRMTLMVPTELDLAFHKACVAELIAFGTLLDIAARDHEDEDLNKHGFERRAIKAILADLQNTLDEWHGQVPDAKIEELQKRIFDATPELNLTNS
jgi:ribosomal 50S subunit-associated protein YjgA (DUF615 family)